jgi:hypothetical protein
VEDSYWIFLDIQCLATPAGTARCASDEIESLRRSSL